MFSKLSETLESKSLHFLPRVGTPFFGVNSVQMGVSTLVNEAIFRVDWDVVFLCLAAQPLVCSWFRARGRAAHGLLVVCSWWVLMVC